MKFFASTLSVLFAATVAVRSIIPSVGAAETQIIATEELNSNYAVATLASPGYNVDGMSIFTNFVTANNDRQFFIIGNFMTVSEKPASEAEKGSFLIWCSDLSFTGVQNSSSSPGYVGNCVYMFLGLAAGVQYSSASTEDFTATKGISAVFVEQLNVIEIQLHTNTDDLVSRSWDDGRPSMPNIGWATMRALGPGTSAFSGVAEYIWTSVEDVAKLFNTTTDKFTPDTFKDVYANVWIKEHEEEAAEKNPNPDAELVIIDQVKNETNGNNGGTGGANDSMGGDGNDNLDGNTGTGDLDALHSTDEGDHSGTTGRKLASVTTRFVSAALRMFGI